MAKKLTLDDLKVQSFVTTLNKQESDELVGGTVLLTDCCTHQPGCRTNLACPDTSAEQCPDTATCTNTIYTDCCSANSTDCCTNSTYCNC